jgi:hypothetical protein
MGPFTIHHSCNPRSETKWDFEGESGWIDGRRETDDGSTSHEVDTSLMRLDGAQLRRRTTDDRFSVLGLLSPVLYPLSSVLCPPSFIFGPRSSVFFPQSSVFCHKSEIALLSSREIHKTKSRFQRDCHVGPYGTTHDLRSSVVTARQHPQDATKQSRACEYLM